MRDDPLNRYLREAKGLPENWCAYRMEVVPTGIRVTGSLTRPADPNFEPHLGRDFDWIKPAQGKRTMTIKESAWRAIFAAEKEVKP